MTFEKGFGNCLEREVDRQEALNFLIKRISLFSVKCAVYLSTIFYTAHPESTFYPRPERYSRFAHCWYIKDDQERYRCWYEKKRQQEIVDRIITQFHENGDRNELQQIYYDMPPCDNNGSFESRRMCLFASPDR
jgi:hypothetical protein|nr:MAG TPA: hypothetical protein [Caudoviricetes sp.]